MKLKENCLEITCNKYKKLITINADLIVPLQFYSSILTIHCVARKFLKFRKLIKVEEARGKVIPEKDEANL